MKQLLLFTLLFFTGYVQSQVQKLNNLSSGKFINSTIIYDDETNDVYGYFLLYRKDQTNKETYIAEYVLLDKNLNKVTSNTFTQSSYKFFLSTVDFELDFVKKIGDQLFIALNDRIYNASSYQASPSYYINPRFRTLDLKTYELSNEKILKNNTFKDQILKDDHRTYLEDFVNHQYVQKTNGDYLLAFEVPENNPKMQLGMQYYAKLHSIHSFSIYDKDLNLKWTQKINQDKKDIYAHYLHTSNQSHFIIKKNIKKGNTIVYDLYSYEKGFVKSLNYNDKNLALDVEYVKFHNNEIVVLAKNFKQGSKFYDDLKVLGFTKIVFDLQGNEKSRHNATWTEVTKNIEFKKPTGEIKKYGNLEIVEFLPLANGNTALLFEGYKYAKNSEVLDLYVAEMDSNFKLKYFKKIEKNKTVYKKVKATGTYIKEKGGFDYLYNQKLDEDGNLVFFYVNNEKEGSRYQKRKNPEWVLGIITYVDGEFNYDKLKLTSKDSKIIPGKAKNGYIRLLEFDDKNVEIRLEKINY